MFRMIVLTLILCATLSAGEKQTVCLNMIVKDESHVITRCLESVKPYVDYWVILDTGSTDGTQEIIQEFMADIPGELHEDPFRNFEYSRNKALEFAKGKADYILFIDADEYFVTEEGFELPALDADFYHLHYHGCGVDYVKRAFIKDALDWRWVGVVHEVIMCDNLKSWGSIGGVTVPYIPEGTRSKDPMKYYKDAAMIEEALKADPENKRYTFYLAQSYRDAGEMGMAIDCYKKRATMEGWDQEVYWSLLQVARLKNLAGALEEDFVADYFKAFAYRPGRAEPLYDLARHYRLKEEYATGYTLASAGCTIAIPQDILFLNKWVYDWGLLLELSVCAYYLERYAETKLLSNVILQRTDIPSNIRELVEKNLAFAEEKLANESTQTQPFAQAPAPQSSETGD